VSAVDLAGNTGSASINISINNQVAQTGPATYTATDVATHNSQSNCWIIVSGKVYNVTQYIPFHPGGANRIINVCGTDATTAFNTRGGSGSHSQNAHNLLAGYYLGDVGAVSNGGTTTPSSSATSTPTGTNGTYTVTVSSNGALSPASLTISAGDTVRFSYTNPGDEVVLTFSPKPPSDIKLDHDSTLKSYTFTQVGTYTYHKKDGGGPTGTIIVQ
jgi:cytochrome b involved in lipid metabolism